VLGLAPSEIEARCEVPAQRDPARACVHDPDETLLVPSQHRIGDPDRAGRRRERRLEHVRAGAVTTDGLEGLLGAELEPPAGVLVEDPV